MTTQTIARYELATHRLNPLYHTCDYKRYGGCSTDYATKSFSIIDLDRAVRMEPVYEEKAACRNHNDRASQYINQRIELLNE